jgi:N-acetylglucosamine-6-phosphate deacetylase
MKNRFIEIQVHGFTGREAMERNGVKFEAVYEKAED